MGIDLRLLLNSLGGEKLEYFLGHTMIDLNRRSELWPLVNKLESKPAGDISGFLAETPDSDVCYGRFGKDPYGSELRAVKAGPLAKTLREFLVKDEAEHGADYWNRAVAAFLSALQPDEYVVLYWH